MVWLYNYTYHSLCSQKLIGTLVGCKDKYTAKNLLITLYALFNS